MPTLTTEFVDRFAKQWIEVWNDHDLDAIMGLCAADVVMFDPATPEPARGREQAKRMSRTTFELFPDFHVDWMRTYVSPTDPELMTQWQLSGTMQGELDPPGFAPTNTRVVLEGATRICFEGESISEVHWFYDVMDLGRQIGAAPEPGSVTERSSVWMQRIKARKLRKLTAA